IQIDARPRGAEAASAGICPGRRSGTGVTSSRGARIKNEVTLPCSFRWQRSRGDAMKCAQAKSLFSLYLDGAVTGTQMRALSQHLEICAGCRQEYLSLHRTQQLLAKMGRRKAPKDLALKLRVAISQEVAQSKRPYLNHMQIRL